VVLKIVILKLTTLSFVTFIIPNFVLSCIAAIEFSFDFNLFKLILVITSPFITKNDLSFTVLPAFLRAPPVPKGLFSFENFILQPKLFFVFR